MRTLCLSCALVALAFATPTAQAPSRPNIVMVILALFSCSRAAISFAALRPAGLV